MTSDRYFCSDNERISWRKVVVLAAVIAVRSRLMKAVFFFKDESRELLTLKRSVSEIRLSSYIKMGSMMYLFRQPKLSS